MKLADDLNWRGLINQTTYERPDRINQPGIKFYFGVDPSAESMTIGNLAAMLFVRRLIEAGHQAYLLVGGATGQIGDPDGKKDERHLKDLVTVTHNKQRIVAQFRRLLQGMDFMVVDNYDWFKDIGYVDFLREVGKHMPMSQMLGREFIKNRLGEAGSGISYAEFSYVLIQAYDFVHLNREFGVELQVCGADQWGNSIAGVDLLRRLDSKAANVLSLPLVVNKSTGRKFGKSEDGAIWLDEAKTSVYKFYQFWLNLDDEGVEDYLKIYTFLSKSEIEDLIDVHRQNPGERAAQKVLAKEVTTLVHGVQRCQSVQRVSRVLFSGQGFKDLNAQDLDLLAQEIPEAKLNQTTTEALVESEIASSNSQARRLIESGAVSVNGQKIDHDIELIEPSLIKKGKNNFVLVR